MTSPDDRPRPLGEVLAAGVLTGMMAGFTVGAIDAIWSWGQAAQFLPGILARLRFVGFVGICHAAAGALAALVITTGLLVLSRATRLGDVLRFGHREHVRRRAADPATAMSGLALAVALLPCVAIALYVAYRLAVPYLANRHVPSLVVVVAMAAGLAAVVVAIPIAFVLGRLLELALGALARKFPRLGRMLSWPYAAIVALVVMLAVVAVGLAHREWETARVLPLRGPLVAIAGVILAVPLWRVGTAGAVLLGVMLPLLRRAWWVALPIVTVALLLASGSSPAVTKAAVAHTGLAGSITRGLRAALDRDRDGYSPILGGGDCDDGDATVHPGAPEIPNDGIDQNCVGGDAKPVKHSLDDVAFVPVPATVPKDFNVVVITIDTTRADHLGAYGYKRRTTPNLDKLAASGTVFEHGWAHAPSTRYSMPAILTGRLPLDVYYDTTVSGWPGILPTATTIAEALAPLGFHTGAITNYWYFDRERHMDQGFAEYDNENAKLHNPVAGAGPEQTRGSSSKQQTDKAVAFVGKHAAERFLLWVHYYDPHYGYEPHPEVPSFGSDRQAQYDNEIAFTDMQIGRLLDDLRARGLYDKTVVVVTGDHGEGFGEHGIELHGYHLYAAQTKVPMIVRVPGIAPRRSTTPAGHVDILPTLVNLAGGTPTAEMEGRSLLDAITGTDRERVVFQQLSYENNHEMRAGASRQCHVIYNVSPDTSWEVYRVDRDPMETIDLAGSDECASTRQEVEHWFDVEQVPEGASEALLTSAPKIATPLAADLGTSVRLLAVDAPGTLHPGDSATLTWTFEARGRIAPGWKMFVHAEGPHKTFYTGDHRPVRPFEWWRAGELIRYTTTLVIPRSAPAGTYTVMAGMFAGPKRAHASAPHAKVVDDAVAVATIEVAP